jgi:hypothetical protein
MLQVTASDIFQKRSGWIRREYNLKDATYESVDLYSGFMLSPVERTTLTQYARRPRAAQGLADHLAVRDRGEVQGDPLLIAAE